MNIVKKAFFLDRDGVINIDHGYISRIDDFDFTDGLFPVLRELLDKGYLLVIVTNQSGIGRGYYTEEDFKRLNDWMLNQLAEQQIVISAVYRCPHTPDDRCCCRKPAPGMLLQAIQELGIDPEQSWMIGDKNDDMVAAKSAGIPHRILLGEAESQHSTHRITKLRELLKLPL